MNQHFLIGESFILEPDRYRLIAKGKETSLSQKETLLLVTLCIFSLSVVERSYLLKNIWGNSESGDIGLNKNILMLRRKFESFGINDAIKTVPRIGYMLLLEAIPITSNKVIEIEEVKPLVANDALSSAPPLKNMNNEVSTEPPQSKEHARRSFFVALASILSVLICIYFIFTWSTHSNFRLIDSVDRYDSQLGVLFIKKDLNNEISSDIAHTINDINIIYGKIAEHAKYYILVSNENISIVSLSHNGTYKQSTFLVANGLSNFSEELLCAVNNITSANNHSIRREKTNNSFKFVSMHFFSNCQDKNFLLSLDVKRSGHPKKIKTVLQSFSAKDSRGTALFHFDRTSERKEINYQDGVQQATFHNTPASLNIDAHELVGSSDDMLKIIYGFTVSKVMQTTIDGTRGVFMSDVMGGVLYLAT